MDKLNKIKASANPLEEARKALAPICSKKMNNCIIRCNKCNTASQSKDIGYGNSDANILIISDYATNNTDYKKYFKELLNNSNINQKDIYCINAVNCICTRKNKEELIERLPSLEELNNCKVYSKYAIDFIKPKIIIIMGAAALNQYSYDNVNLIQNAGADTYICGIKSLVTYSTRDIFNLTKMDNDNVDDAIEQIINTFNKAQEYIDDLRGE